VSADHLKADATFDAGRNGWSRGESPEEEGPLRVASFGGAQRAQGSLWASRDVRSSWFCPRLRCGPGWCGNGSFRAIRSRADDAAAMAATGSRVAVGATGVEIARATPRSTRCHARLATYLASSSRREYR